MPPAGRCLPSSYALGSRKAHLHLETEKRQTNGLHCLIDISQAILEVVAEIPMLALPARNGHDSEQDLWLHLEHFPSIPSMNANGISEKVLKSVAVDSTSSTMPQIRHNLTE